MLQQKNAENQVRKEKVTGKVFWLMGLSGSGKTTLGIALTTYLSSIGRDAVFLDGDHVREFFGNDLGFSRSDRIESVKRILLAAYYLSTAGKDVIVANTHPFEELRQLARRTIQKYHEIYLNRSFESCRKADPKGIYKKHLGRTPMLGKEIEFEEPLHSDMAINTEKLSEGESKKELFYFALQKTKRSLLYPFGDH